MCAEIHQPERQRTLSILCVDDDAALVRVLQIALERAGHTVEVAKDGAIALERITANLMAYNVIVTDHQMPNLSGLDLVTRLRFIGFGGKIVVHCSPLDRQVGDHYQSLQVDEIIYKPTTLEGFLKAVEGSRATDSQGLPLMPNELINTNPDRDLFVPAQDRDD